MAPPIFDLNLPPPDPELHDSIDWSSIGEWEGPADGLEYDMVWHEGAEGEEEIVEEDQTASPIGM